MTQPGAIMLPTLAMLAVPGMAGMAGFAIAVIAPVTAPDPRLPTGLISP